jgi:hypothetical protein
MIGLIIPVCEMAAVYMADCIWLTDKFAAHFSPQHSEQSKESIAKS